MSYLNTIIILIFSTVVCANDRYIEFKLRYHIKEVPQDFVFDLEQKVTFSKNCFDNKWNNKKCIARQRLSTPLKLIKTKPIKPNASISALTCKNNLAGLPIYLKSEDNSLEGFCYFESDHSAVSLQVIRSRYKNKFIDE
tara:strand:+ start:152 stop:568 length:417 start_codon:yes stop_codon:yes gene_type:complete